ncbi:hypothetical protein HUS23_06225 [Ectothiorhodospiraceae bacterium 2226]|nr:hypothetical protein HUS23_06225 [Ectothiorhodospiraceae bacterium 2226]
MPQNQGTKDRQMRHRIAQEAARLIAETGLTDYYAAKRKAATLLGAPDTRNMPRNVEVEEALHTHLRLFRRTSHLDALRDLRAAALRAMRLTERFEPRLVGPVLAGTADIHSPVHLHLFADTTEEVSLFLMERNIPFELDERRVRLDAERTENFPVFRFMAGEAVLELTVFPRRGLRQAPLSPVDGRPMQRAGATAVEALLAADGEAGAL